MGFFTNNVGWKLLSLAAAFFIWVNIASEPELATILSAPVEYKNYPKDLENQFHHRRHGQRRSPRPIRPGPRPQRIPHRRDCRFRQRQSPRRAHHYAHFGATQPAARYRTHPRHPGPVALPF